MTLVLTGLVFPIIQVSKSDDFQLKREVSIYSIGDLLKETVANETLTDLRDRKYFLVTQKQRCCKPPPLFVPALSLIQVLHWLVNIYRIPPSILHICGLENKFQFLNAASKQEHFLF